MHPSGGKTWEERHQELLGRAKEMKQQPVVDRQELAALQDEIRTLERSRERPLPVGMTPHHLSHSDLTDRTGRAPSRLERRRSQHRCPFGNCDGSGWLLHESEDAASPCKCQRLPRDGSARRQTSRILKRHLALSLDTPPLVELDPASLGALREYANDIRQSVAAGDGLWFASVDTTAETICAYLAGEALRRDIPVLLYPGDELIGRLRRLAADGSDRTMGVPEEIERLARIDLLVISGLDSAACSTRYPEARTQPEESEEAEVESSSSEATPYGPAMTEADLSRLFEVVDERLMNERSTVITTEVGIPFLEENLLRVPGEWPERGHSSDGLALAQWDEARRRASNLSRLISRLRGLCGEPIVPRMDEIDIRRIASDRDRILSG